MKLALVYLVIFFTALSTRPRVTNEEFIKQGLIELGLDSVNVHVMDLKYSLAQSVPSNYELKGHLSGANDQYIMQLSRGMTHWEERQVIAHELIHIQQYYTKKLQIIDAKHVVYDGKKLRYLGKYSLSSPWEREAHVEGNRLYRKLKQHFKQQGKK